MKKITSIIILYLLSFNLLNAQSFTTSLNHAGLDFNHYSIEMSPDQTFYGCAGTIFDGDNSTNIHVLKLDLNGRIIWEKTINLGSQDRGLDVTVDDANNIIITGHVTYLHNHPNLYVARFQSNGTFLDDYSFMDEKSTGANIIYSSADQSYYIGGMTDGDLAHYQTTVTVNNYALVLKLDNNLNFNWLSYLRESITDGLHSSINDLTMISNGQIFVTGSMSYDSPNTKQGVLAVTLDEISGVLMSDYSFASGDDPHIGISAVYDNYSDELWLLTNNMNYQNPQINRIDNVSGGGILNQGYILNIDPSSNENPAGFKMEFMPGTNRENLTVAGYYNYQTTHSTDPSIAIGDSNLWIADFEKYSGNQVNGLFIWNAPSIGYSSHGGNMFSSFRNTQPYLFNQEIMCINHLNNGYVFIAPRILNSHYTFDITSIEKEISQIETCNFLNSFNSFAVLHLNKSVIDLDIIIPDLHNITIPSNTFHCQKQRCDFYWTNNQQWGFIGYSTPVDPMNPTDPCMESDEGGPVIVGVPVPVPGIGKPGHDNDEGTPNGNLPGPDGKSFSNSNQFNDLTSVDIYPNPVNNILNIEKEGIAAIIIYNTIGEIVFEKNDILNSLEKVDVSKYAKGLYMVKVIDSNNQAYMNRVIIE